MVKSILIKAGMLAATGALVIWIGWPIQEQKTSEAVPQPWDEAGVIQALEPAPVTDTTAPRGAFRQAERKEQVAKSRQAGHNSKLDINRATVRELQNLPGIGEVLAQRVVEHRKAYGPFQTIDELKSVKGIGRKRIEQLRPLVSVGVEKEMAHGVTQKINQPAQQSRKDL